MPILLTLPRHPPKPLRTLGVPDMMFFAIVRALSGGDLLGLVTAPSGGDG